MEQALDRVKNLFERKDIEIANISNYPTSLKSYLYDERVFFDSFIKRNYFTSVIEIGCMDGQLLFPIIIQNRLNYYGVDLVSYMVESVNNLISQYQLSNEQKAIAICGDAIDLPILAKKHKLPDENVLVVFPFNGFGHLAYPEAVIQGLSRLRYDILILSYDTTPLITKVRTEYYEACGFRDLRHQKDEKGIIFQSSDGLHVYAYSSSTIKNFMTSKKYNVEVSRFGTNGVGSFGQLDRPAKV